MRPFLILALLTSVASAAPRKVEITAAEAKAHKLAEHRISVDITDSSLSDSKFGDADVYLTLSGPPGGPLGMQLLQNPKRYASDAEFRVAVMTEQKVTAATKVVKLQFAGRTWRCVAFIRGESMARSLNWYLVDDKGLAIHADHGAQRTLTDADAASILKGWPFDKVLRSLTID